MLTTEKVQKYLVAILNCQIVYNITRTKEYIHLLTQSDQIPQKGLLYPVVLLFCPLDQPIAWYCILKYEINRKNN